jgi:hypothetical protein
MSTVSYEWYEWSIYGCNAALALVGCVTRCMIDVIGIDQGPQKKKKACVIT